MGFNSIHDFDIICLSETYFDSSYALEDSDLQIDSYTIITADHPMDIQQGGLCVYRKDYLAVATLIFLLLIECIILEIEVDSKKIILLTLYRSPLQYPEMFTEFIENFESDLKTIYSFQLYLIPVIEGFNVK